MLQHKFTKRFFLQKCATYKKNHLLYNKTINVFFNWRAIQLRVKNLVYPLQSSFKLFLLKLSRDRTFITHTVEVLQFKGVVYIQIFNLPTQSCWQKGKMLSHTLFSSWFLSIFSLHFFCRYSIWDAGHTYIYHFIYNWPHTLSRIVQLKKKQIQCKRYIQQ